VPEKASAASLDAGGAPRPKETRLKRSRCSIEQPILRGFEIPAVTIQSDHRRLRPNQSSPAPRRSDPTCRFLLRRDSPAKKQRPSVTQRSPKEDSEKKLPATRHVRSAIRPSPDPGRW